MKIQPILDKNYLEFLHDIKSIIISARISAARYVNSELILLYWDIGRGIVEKQKELGWGESVVEVLSRDLRRIFPDIKGFSIDNLWRMRKLYNTYSSIGFLAQLVPEINSRHPHSAIRPLAFSSLSSDLSTEALAKVEASAKADDSLFILDRSRKSSDYAYIHVLSASCF